MRVAGIDPGTIRTGVGILEEASGKAKLLFSGTIHAGSERTIAERLEIIFRELKEVFAKWQPDIVVIETVFFQKDFKAAVKVGEARAAAMLAASTTGIPIAEYPPARIKQSIGANGRATKEQIQYMVKQILRLPGVLQQDSSDAVAAALCHFHCHKFAQFTIENGSKEDTFQERKREICPL